MKTLLTLLVAAPSALAFLTWLYVNLIAPILEQATAIVR